MDKMSCTYGISKLSLRLLLTSKKKNTIKIILTHRINKRIKSKIHTFTTTMSSFPAYVCIWTLISLHQNTTLFFPLEKEKTSHKNFFHFAQNEKRKSKTTPKNVQRIRMARKEKDGDRQRERESE